MLSPHQCIRDLGKPPTVAKPIQTLLASLLLTGVCCFGNPAHALVIPLAELMNTSVPANGVLRFSIQDGITVRILAADGTEVPGSFVAPGVWRPDEPFELGTYTADVTWEEAPNWARDATFEVTPAVDPSSELVDVVVTPRVDADGSRVIEQECCLAGETRPPEPCSGVCPPLCVGTVYEAKLVVTVSGSPINDAIAWQVEVREVGTTVEGEFTLGYWDVTGTPDALCGIVEVFSWLDGSTTAVGTCVDNPKPELEPVEFPVEGFGTTSECTIPPPGYEILWCDERRYLCEEWLLTPEGEQHEDTVRACEHYAEVCGPDGDVKPPDTPPISSSGVDTTSANSTVDPSTIPPEGSGETTSDGNDGEPRLRGIQSSKGCSVVSAPRMGLDWAVWLTALGLGGLGFGRRRSRLVEMNR